MGCISSERTVEECMNFGYEAKMTKPHGGPNDFGPNNLMMDRKNLIIFSDLGPVD